MKRFVLAAALAAILSLGLADRAAAQVVYGTNTVRVNPYSGTWVNNRTVVTPFSAQSATSYYNPFLGYGGQNVRYQNAWGAGYSYGYGVNPHFGPYQYGAYRVPVTPWGTTYPSWYMFR